MTFPRNMVTVRDAAVAEAGRAVAFTTALPAQAWPSARQRGAQLADHLCLAGVGIVTGRRVLGDGCASRVAGQTPTRPTNARPIGHVDCPSTGRAD